MFSTHDSFLAVCEASNASLLPHGRYGIKCWPSAREHSDSDTEVDLGRRGSSMTVTDKPSQLPMQAKSWSGNRSQHQSSGFVEHLW